MPANLSPEYEKAEQRLRHATTDADRLVALREMLATIPKHKGTEKMQADIKRRLSQLRKDWTGHGPATGPDPFHIPRSGAGQVVLVGPPNSGKSRLVEVTTHAGVKVADYPFTTTVPHPGMWVRDGIPIELVDTPPLTPNHFEPGLMGTIRGGDIVCVVVEGGPSAVAEVEGTLAGLRSRDLVLRTAALAELPTTVVSCRCGLVIVNKVDLGGRDAAATVRVRYRGQLEVLETSAATGEGLEAWFRRLAELLNLVRVFTKEPGAPPDRTKPFVLRAGSTVADLARLIHRDLPELMKSARLWGHSRFDGQQVHRTEVLKDGDVVEIHR